MTAPLVSYALRDETEAPPVTVLSARCSARARNTVFGDRVGFGDAELSVMRLPVFQLDAFAERRFAGNPAAVVPMERFLDDDVLQAIAAENNLAETAFLVPEGRDYRLRRFTPVVEVPLGGHATLASAAVVIGRLEPGRTKVVSTRVAAR
jgi:hypothetical protein